MQSIFRLPWCVDPIAHKVSEKDALNKMRSTPVVEIPVLNKLKRKRANNSDVILQPQTQESKKPRPEATATPVAPPANARAPSESGVEQTSMQAPVANSLANAEPLQPAQAPDNFKESISITHFTRSPAGKGDQRELSATSADPIMRDVLKPASEDALGLTPLQQVIENEFNTQILMKHDELRLIDQELAKCQIALEQLRRCEVRPYPGNQGLSGGVSAGIGPSVAPPHGFSRPTHPAPHGVCDGPYSRHYRQWLLQDPQFDAMPLQTSLPVDPYARSTRNSGSVRQSISKNFVLPSRLETLHSMPKYPAPAPRDKSAPLVLRRSTDNQLVKLICNNCNRGNFSSIQGFLNHCRIAHKVDYKSHDAAAIDCGRLLDENEVASLPPETQSTPAPKASVNRASAATSTPIRNFIHPFNTTTGASLAVGNSRKPSPATRMPMPSLKKNDSSNGSPLTPSVQVPRLSAYFAKHQCGGDLEKAAANARQKIDLGAEEDLLSPDASELDSPLERASGSRKGLNSGRAGMTVAGGRLTSQKGSRQPLQRPRPSPLGPPTGDSGLEQDRSEISGFPQDLALDLSPQTADSNPGLVSDHEDDDHGSASEEEAPRVSQAEMRRPIGVPRTCADVLEIDVAVDDDMDESGVIIRRNSMFAEDERGLRGAGSPSRNLGMGKRGA